MEAHARALAARGTKTKLFELAAERNRDRLTSSIWTRALEHGDAVATSLIDEAVAALAAGIASAVNLLDVEAVVIGGGLGLRLGEPYRERIATAMTPHLWREADPVAVHLAELGDLGGALGATLLVDQQ
jgi:glucokinase